jgi:hypothetical protein
VEEELLVFLLEQFLLVTVIYPSLFFPLFVLLYVDIAEAADSAFKLVSTSQCGDVCVNIYHLQAEYLFCLCILDTTQT